MTQSSNESTLAVAEAVASSRMAETPDAALEVDLRTLYRDVARLQQEVRHRAQDLAVRYPQSRDARFLLAEVLRASGEPELALAEYRSLRDGAPSNECRRIEQAMKLCEPELAYQTLGFLAYLNGIQFARPEHRTYLLRDLERGRRVAQVLRQWLPLRGQRVLDVGSSHGGMVMALAEQGSQAVGIEIEPRRSQVGCERVRELGYEIEWHTGDICDPDLAARLGDFDAVICQDVLEHVMDPQCAIRHLCALLRPGGIIYLAVPNKYAAGVILGDHHYRIMGISLLARAQGLEYFELATGIPAAHYDTGYYRTEKFYRSAFTRGGVELQPVEQWPTVEQVFWFAPVISALASRLAEPIYPGLRPELAARIRRRARKVVELYVHACRVLKELENQPEALAAACHLVVSRLGVELWRFIGTKTRPVAVSS